MLALIEQAEGKNIIFDSDHIKTNITKCDYENNGDFKRPWVDNKMIESIMSTSVHPMIRELDSCNLVARFVPIRPLIP